MEDPGPTDDAVTAYQERIPEEHRPLFDRVHQLILATAPGAERSIAYGMPAFRQGKRRLYLATWKHGISLYGWDRDHDGGFADRHPGLLHGRGTIRLSVTDAAGVSDDELVALIRGALSAEE